MKEEIAKDYHYEILKTICANGGILNPNIREGLKNLNIRVDDIKSLINDLENNSCEMYLKHKDVVNEFLFSFS